MSGVDLLIADCHEFVRIGLISIIGASHPEWNIVAEAASGSAAIELGTALRPNVAILEVSLPGGGLDVARRLLASVPGIRILILTRHSAAPVLREARRAGVHAFLAKNEAVRTVITAVERILAGEAFFASDSASRPVLAPPEYIPVQFLLSSKELDVLRLLARGKSNKELAADLNISVRTAETHHANILAKLKAESPGALVRMAFRDGLL